MNASIPSQQNPHFSPTSEQQQALASAQTNASFKILAYAGAGKTATLKMISEAKGKQSRGMYLAFNKAIATEAKEKFPFSVDCRTFHSLAFRHVPRNITAKISLPRYSPSALASIFGLENITLRKKQDGRYEYVLITPAQQASMVNDAVSRFCTTHAQYPATRHILPPEWLHEDDADSLREHLYPFVEKRWQQACDPNHEAGIGHEIYLKLWALSSPRIPADYILFDEAQDADPLMLGILLAQTDKQVIYVGDAHQQIYEWRGATNAMKRLPLPETRLTKSFRFGERIADVANVFLRELGETVPLLGNDALNSSVLVNPNFPQKNAILCRTNAQAMKQLIAGLQQNHKIALQADTQRLVRFADASEQLKAGKRVNHVPELAYFKDWSEVLSFTEMAEGSDLKSLVRMIDDYGSTALKSAIKKLYRVEQADYVISTAHKAKGLEWFNVQIDDDYNYSLESNKNQEDGVDISNEELRLLYVACTRAKIDLNVTGINNLIAGLEKQQGIENPTCTYKSDLDKRKNASSEQEIASKLADNQTTKKYTKKKGLSAIQQAKLNKQLKS